MMTKRTWACWAAAIVVACAAWGADSSDDEAKIKKYEDLVKKGKADELDAALRGGVSTFDFKMLALAYHQKALGERRDAGEREKAYAKSAEYYEKWINNVGEDLELSKAKRDFDEISARVAYGEMIVNAWCSGALDEYEITSGLKFDATELLRRLNVALKQYQAAWRLLQPMLDNMNDPEHENEYFALGIFDELRKMRLSLMLRRSWAAQYVGKISKDEKERADALKLAESSFRELINSGYAGQNIYECYAGLGMTLYKLGRYDEAESAFKSAEQEGSTAELRLMVVYERGRMAELRGAYDKTREVLKPLLERDPDRLMASEKNAAFFVNVARIIEANSYLREANQAREQAKQSRSARSLLREANRKRDLGLRRFRELAQKGGAWPKVARLYIAESVDLSADPTTLSATELLYASQLLVELNDVRKAVEWLELALKAEDIDERLTGEVLFELGRCQYRLNRLLEAAETFEKLAKEQPTHVNAQEAGSNAFKLYAKLAQDANSREYYGKAADALKYVLEQFPRYPNRDEAVWDLAVVLQAAGRAEEAAEAFAQTPEKSRNWEEAQYRQAVCRRQAVEQLGHTVSDEEYRQRAAAAAQALKDYATAARGRAADASNRFRAEKAGQFADEALISAAELLVSMRVAEFDAALAIVGELTKADGESELAGRILGVRIKAHRGRREFDQAAKLLSEYLAAVKPERAGAVLSSLAMGMQEEVMRMREDGETEEAKSLATDAVSTFEQLKKWVQEDASRAGSAGVVDFGLARMLFFAGEIEKADALVDKLLEESPKNGNYQRLRAQLLSERLDENASQEAVRAAMDAWAELLKDRGLREQAPERYWEATYNRLELALRLGEAEAVCKAITQQRVWNPDLGGAPWKERLETLRRTAAEQAGVNLDEEEQPTTDASGEAPEAEAETEEVGAE